VQALRALFGRTRHDREILRLAVPALGSLAAEPLYILVDTAIVGHLGRPQLAALGIAAIILGSCYGIFNFLAYGTTALVARADGAGRRDMADALGIQAFWLSLALGLVLAGAIAAAAGPLVELVGGEGGTAELAVTYTRIASLGLVFAFLALGGQGYMRGIGDLRTPLVILVVANVANAILEVLFVYGFGWGLTGSAWGTVIAQAGMGLAFARYVLRGRDRAVLAPSLELVGRLLSIGRHILVRTTALLASVVVAGAAIARFGDASIAAHQIVFQLWGFLALVLDSVAIAGQVIVGRLLGAGDPDGAFASSVRMIGMSVLVGAACGAVFLALGEWIPLIFTSDELVLDRVQAVWWIFALMQPLNGAVFALDGILIGAGDARYLMWSMLVSSAAAVPVALLALELDLGIAGVWLALLVLIVVRLATLGVRFLRRRWLVTGFA